MTSKALEKERVLVIVDPASCGEAALQQALDELDPELHQPTVGVVAKAPDDPGSGDEPTRSAEFAYADAALANYLRIAEAAGFLAADGWVIPDRREQMVREITVAGPYARALAVSPSGRWRRLMKRDITGLLESVGIEASLHCDR